MLRELLFFRDDCLVFFSNNANFTHDELETFINDICKDFTEEANNTILSLFIWALYLTNTATVTDPEILWQNLMWFNAVDKYNEKVGLSS